jgi:CheY-like chemotaxis protein
MKILFVDDDADDVHLFFEAVEYLNDSELVKANDKSLQCLTVSDGQQALEQLNTDRNLPDLIFLDINMPVMDGKSCLMELKRDRRLSNIPVVMFSTTYRGNDKFDYQSMGAEKCLTKPSGFKDLVKMLAQVVYDKVF